MIRFETEIKPRITAKELKKMHIIDVLEDERDFSIVVAGQAFFCQPYFPVLELAQYCQHWLRSPKRDFLYSTIETEENPLLAFHKQKDGWKIKSVWQQFECEEIFSDDEVMDFVRGIIDYVTQPSAHKS